MNEFIKIPCNFHIPLHFDVPSALMSPYRGGGHFSTVVFPECLDDMLEISRLLIESCAQYLIVGACGNTLVKDEGYNGIAIITKHLKKISVKSETVTLGAGEYLPQISLKMAKAGLSGFESLSGIPATIGGAIAMNAGAFGREISELIDNVRVYDLIKHETVDYSAKEIPFSYRSTNGFFKSKIIISARFKLAVGSSETMRLKIIAFARNRAQTQPRQPSLGCVFKKINGVSAGKYIEDVGLKGLTVGGARISCEHANFIVNIGNGSATDYIKLMEIAKKEVFEKFKLCLENEVVLV
ncbi:MAG: UDP-N-acetylmuramate dehydrogenase [Christensenellaceae bacterium]|jgi:UDP-N-acetylmuramate dehydrogenase|nr:UDP-N-acetylmuramate dehydrogenase [Christensenellaceae bacterium]